MILFPCFRSRWVGTAQCLLVLGVIGVTAENGGAQAPPVPETIQAPAAVGQAVVDLSGCWSGHWEDCRSGHSGPLSATFCKCDDSHYRVTFTGRFFKVLPFRYTVVLSVVGLERDKVLLSGQSDLGPLFGTFSYRAEASATQFVADYSSCRYQGKFILSRCCGQ